MRLILELQTCTSVRPTAWASAGAERPSDAAFNDGASVPIVLIWELSSRLEALVGPYGYSRYGGPPRMRARTSDSLSSQSKHSNHHVTPALA